MLCYARRLTINQIIFLGNNLQWFGIYLYAIKQIMQLTEFECIINYEPRIMLSLLAYA